VEREYAAAAAAAVVTATAAAGFGRDEVDGRRPVPPRNRGRQRLAGHPRVPRRMYVRILKVIEVLNVKAYEGLSLTKIRSR
jgi:hypothetical protein